MPYSDLKRILDGADRIVFFGGAGVSTGSGIPDFRGSGGLYTDEEGQTVPPETILSAAYLARYPEDFSVITARICSIPMPARMRRILRLPSLSDGEN